MGEDMIMSGRGVACATRLRDSCQQEADGKAAMRGLKLDDRTTTNIQTFEMCVRKSIGHPHHVHETHRHVTPEWREFYDKAYANVESADR